MKLIDEKEVKVTAENYADKHGFRVPYDGSNNFYDITDVSASLEGFKNGVEYAEQTIIPIMIEFAEYIGDFYTRNKYKEWCTLGYSTINTTKQLLEQYLKLKL